MSRATIISFLVLIVAFIALSSAQEAERQGCVTTTGFNGFCVNILKCEPLLRLIQSVPLEEEDKNYLRSTQCGWDGNMPTVCCVPEDAALNQKS